MKNRKLFLEINFYIYLLRINSSQGKSIVYQFKFYSLNFAFKDVNSISICFENNIISQTNYKN